MYIYIQRQIDRQIDGINPGQKRGRARNPEIVPSAPFRLTLDKQIDRYIGLTRNI